MLRIFPLYGSSVVSLANVRTCSRIPVNAAVMDIPRLEAKEVALDLVDDPIKHDCLDLGYAATTSYQVKTIRSEFLQGSDIFVSLPTGEGKSLYFAALPGVFDFLKRSLALSS